MARATGALGEALEGSPQGGCRKHGRPGRAPPSGCLQLAQQPARSGGAAAQGPGGQTGPGSQACRRGPGSDGLCALRRLETACWPWELVGPRWRARCHHQGELPRGCWDPRLPAGLFACVCRADPRPVCLPHRKGQGRGPHALRTRVLSWGRLTRGVRTWAVRTGKDGL